MDCPIYGASPRAKGMRKAERDGASRDRGIFQQKNIRDRIPASPPRITFRKIKVGSLGASRLGMVFFRQNPSIFEGERKKQMITFKEAQKLVKDFAKLNKWKDVPNVDKFDHLHEELIEMSQHLRYKSEKERKKYVRENKDVFIDGIGDLLFGLCRLANQLDVDMESAFELSKKEILGKYNHRNPENNIVKMNPRKG